MTDTKPTKKQRRTKLREPVPMETEEQLPDELFDPDDLPEPSEEFNRYSKLADPNIYNMILEYLRDGNYIKTAADAAGVDSSVVHRWISKGEKGENKVYYQFYVDVNRAIAEGESLLVNKIRKAADKDWKAAMALLSRRHRSRWGDNRTGTGEGASNIEYNDNRQILAVQASNDPESRELIRKLVGRAGGDQE